MAAVMGHSYAFGEGHGSLDAAGAENQAIEERAKAFYKGVVHEIEQERFDRNRTIPGRPEAEALASPLPADCRIRTLRARTDKPLLDYAGAAMAHGYVQVVSGRLRAILEEAGEAGLFWPVEVLHPDGRVAEGEWLAWQLTAVLDAIDPESEGFMVERRPWADAHTYTRRAGVPTTGPEARAQMRVRREVIAGHAAWHEMRYQHQFTVLSDAAVEAANAAGIQGWEMRLEMGEV